MPLSNLAWVALAATNLLIQLLCFFRDESRPLYWAKKTTTPLLLLGGFAIVWHASGTAFSVASVLLLAMGVGEIGIEGSSVVTSRSEPPSSLDRWLVTTAGVIFIAVNVFLGGVLLARANGALPIAVGFAAAAASVGAMVALVLRLCAPEATVRTQMLLYAPGLVVLAAGAIAALFGPGSRLGTAAILLTVSDSLVLIRMGAGLDEEVPRERNALLILLISILLLYYAYIATLIGTGSPFSR